MMKIVIFAFTRQIRKCYESIIYFTKYVKLFYYKLMNGDKLSKVLYFLVALKRSNHNYDNKFTCKILIFILSQA